MATGRIIKITPEGNQRGYWRLCWQRRELLYFLARRDLVIRYRQTIAGLVWVLMRPAGQVLAFTLLFGTIAKLPNDGLPYPVLAMSGVVCWGFYNAILNQAINSLIKNINLITKVNLPRILLPIGTVAPNIIDLFINLLAFALLCILFQVVPSWRLFLLPIPILLAAGIGLGIGFWASAASVKYRDLRTLIPFIIQIQFLLTPVGYSSSAVHTRLPEWGQTLFYANPMVACIDLMRWCLLPAGYAPQQNFMLLLISLSAGIILLISGQWFFRRQERTFADVI